MRAEHVCDPGGHGVTVSFRTAIVGTGAATAN
jgi:hypothetical protein